MVDILLGPAVVWWLGLFIFGAALLGALGHTIWTWARGRFWPAPRPTPRAMPGEYVVRWEHINFCSRTIYQGPNLAMARHQFYHAEGILPGATVEFWDGPDCRARRTA